MSVTVIFDGFPAVIESELKQAKKQLVIAVAWITFQRYAPILRSAASSGVSVRVYCADQASNRKQMREINELRRSGVEVTLYRMPRSTNFMHHKFAVVDEHAVITGSFNWSDNAMRSFENLLVVKDEPKVIHGFLGEVAKLAALNEAAIRSLQALKQCQRPGCSGRILYILVIHPDAHPITTEHWGDVVKTCSVCAEEQFQVIEAGVQVSHLYSYLNAPEHIDLEEDVNAQGARFNRFLDEYLTIEGNRGRSLHAIGMVAERASKNGDGDRYVKIIWRNKFVDEHLQDEYETTFGL